MAAKVNVDELPRAQRVESELEFITGVLQEWRQGKGLEGDGLAARLQKAKVEEFVGEMRKFYTDHVAGRPTNGSTS